jgi:CRP-like cAMP-binding protein
MTVAHAPSLAHPPLRLTLLPNDVLPQRLNWRIQEGYIRTATWDDNGDTITLGVWGPGDWITSAYSELRSVEIQCLTTVVVEQFSPGAADIQQLLLRQIQNLEELFQINRIRAADERLLGLLAWIGRRFGQVSTRGYRLSLKDMNLTHKALADLCGLTRVTVTKMLNRYKSDGVLQQVSKDDLFIPSIALGAATA